MAQSTCTQSNEWFFCAPIQNLSMSRILCYYNFYMSWNLLRKLKHVSEVNCQKKVCCEVTCRILQSIEILLLSVMNLQIWTSHSSQLNEGSELPIQGFSIGCHSITPPPPLLFALRFYILRLVQLFLLSSLVMDSIDNVCCCQLI